MNWIALKMLMGDKAKYLGIIFGLTFASLLITQQASIFVGLMSRTYGFLDDSGLPGIWVMDPKVQYIDDLKPLSDTELLRVRGIEGVRWAVPLYKGLLKARLQNGLFQTCIVIGIDDASLINGPPIMLEGKIEDLRRADGVIVDEKGVNELLARPDPANPEKKIPLKVGDTFELNDKRALIVGICRSTRTFQGNNPMVYTTYTRALKFAPRERKQLSFVLVQPKDGEDVQKVIARIQDGTGLAAYTTADLKWKTVMYFIKNTGIPINFGISVMLGFLVGTAIAGQTFYNFTLENIKQFGALKAMGATNMTLLRMILLQALQVGLIGYGLGVGATALFGLKSKNSELAFRMLPEILYLGAGAITFICIVSAMISIIKVMRLEPAIVFKG